MVDYEWLKDLPGSHRFINNFSEIDPNEWDAVITDRFLHVVDSAHLYKTSDWQDYVTHSVPANLMIFYVFPTVPLDQRLCLVNVGPKISEVDGGSSEVFLKWGIPGHEVRRVANLPEAIQELVNSSLLPTISARATQFGFARTAELPLPKSGLKIFRPFLFGPQEYILAGNFVTLNGISVWVLPDDLKNKKEWFELALNEWHAIRPLSFPGIGIWQTSPVWFTTEERAIDMRILETRNALDETERQLRSELERMTEELQIASEAANLGRRRLLWAQDEPLQQAVLEALRDIGFIVEDMDLVWKEREPREDYRITAPDAPDWIVLGDATGVTTGAKGSKIGKVLGYVTKYVLDENPISAPGVWILINQLIGRDPETRGELYRSDDLEVLTSANSLAIDTCALFVLVEACALDHDRSSALRGWLRGLRGQLTLEMARTWLTENGVTPTEN